GHDRLLDWRPLRAQRLHGRGAARRNPPLLHHARPQPHRKRLPAREHRLARATGKVRLQIRGRGAELPADQRPLAQPRALRQSEGGPAGAYRRRVITGAGPGGAAPRNPPGYLGQDERVMTVWVALLRAVNVAGVNRLPMEEFRALLSGLGLEGARTYIQSGNAVFRSARSAGELQALIADAVLARFGFRPPVLMRTLAELVAAHRACPFRDAAGDRVFFHFMDRELPRATGDFLAALAAPGERHAFHGRVLWLH